MSGDSKYDLEQIQRWMQAVIVHPLGVEEGLASDGARQHLDVAPVDVEQVVTRSKALSAVERLAIYGYAYYARLLECLKEEFPAVLRAVGEEAFDSFALGYLQKYPSRSYTLFELGARFPAYLDETRPADEPEVDGPTGDSWIQLVIDLATFERVVGEVFDGPGPEEGGLLGQQELSAVGGEQLLAARLVPVECLRLLALRFPVDDFYKAARDKQSKEPPTPPAAAETYIAVTRMHYVVCHHRLSRPAYELLSSILAGDCLAAAIERAVASSPDAQHELTENLQSWFTDWAARGYFRRIELAADTNPTRKRGTLEPEA